MMKNLSKLLKDAAGDTPKPLERSSFDAAVKRRRLRRQTLIYSGLTAALIFGTTFTLVSVNARDEPSVNVASDAGTTRDLTSVPGTQEGADIDRATVDGSVTTSAPEAVSVPDSQAAAGPVLSISPSGPYHHLQDVIVTGSGFEPGTVVTGGIAQCPAGIDTARDEQCGRWDIDNPLFADDQGQFSMVFRLYESTPQGISCLAPPGCVLAWVPPHSSMIAEVPLEFG